MIFVVVLVAVICFHLFVFHCAEPAADVAVAVDVGYASPALPAGVSKAAPFVGGAADVFSVSRTIGVFVVRFPFSLFRLLYFRSCVAELFMQHPPFLSPSLFRGRLSFPWSLLVCSACFFCS